jgi:hypothetical protein
MLQQSTKTCKSYFSYYKTIVLFYKHYDNMPKFFIRFCMLQTSVNAQAWRHNTLLTSTTFVICPASNMADQVNTHFLLRPQAWLCRKTYYSESSPLICLGEEGFDILQPWYFETPRPNHENQQGINVWQLPILEMFEGKCLIFRSYDILNPLLWMEINRGSMSHNHNILGPVL